MITNIIWILIASALGFGITAVFSGWLKLQRNVFLLIYIPLIAAFFISFILYNDFDVRDLIVKNWYWGITGAVLAAVFVIKNVLSQPSSEHSKGLALLSDIIWPGFAYGLTDSLLLSVLPVLAVQSALTATGWMEGWAGKIGFGVIAMLASFLVTAVYHWGYHEFRGKKVIWPMIGNGVLSLAYILTGNPLAAILPHIGMHITAMIHGKETTGQVPPHYNDSTIKPLIQNS